LIFKNCLYDGKRKSCDKGNVQSSHAHNVSESFLLPTRAIGEKVSGQEVKKGDRIRVQPEGCRLQGDESKIFDP